MSLFWVQLALFFLCGTSCLASGKREIVRALAGLGTITACAIGAFLAFSVLKDGITLTAMLPLSLPLGQASFTLDPLAAFFLLPVYCIGIFSSYLLLVKADQNFSFSGAHGFFFCLLLASILLVATASDAFLFLLFWEVMSLAPFFLLTSKNPCAQDQFAGRVYLIAAHLGALPLFLLFGSLVAESGATSFTGFQAMGEWPHAGTLFFLALIGFGLKLGLFPLHVWMPEAYPAAPPHVAMLLSGGMINIGFYGLLRTLAFLGTPAPWMPHTLMLAGLASGLFGVMFALVQKDMKRVLAYSSSENMGIIILGFGACLLSLQQQNTSAAALFFGGAFLHIWNHALFKSLLFLGAGAISQATGTSEINRLGGLAKRLPAITICMGVGSAAIACLPPLNGFMGEVLLYLGFTSSGSLFKGTDTVLIFWAGLFALSGIAGLALFCFTRLFGLVFLGAPRSLAAAEATPVSRPYCHVGVIMAVGCFAAGLAAPWLYTLLAPVQAHLFSAFGLSASFLPVAHVEQALASFATGSALLMAAIALVALYRRWVISRNGMKTGMTWDCGYCLPTAKMQYTGGSFAHTPALIFSLFLRMKITRPRLHGVFPLLQQATMEDSHWIMRGWNTLFFQSMSAVAEKSRWFQQGFVNIYILYILVALMVALIWAVGYA